MNKEPIRVLLVDDSALVLLLLSRILTPDTGIQIVGTAKDGEEALRKIPLLDPQVICTDLQMSGMNGLELTRRVMARYPRPILVLSSAVEAGKNNDNIFKLLAAGAVDILPKPRGTVGSDLTEVGKDLIAKIKLLAGVVTFTRRSRNIDSPTPTANNPILNKTKETQATKFIPYSTKIVAIGASTGGPNALHTILSTLPEKLPFPIVCIQHIGKGFTEDLVDWLNGDCPLTVRVAKVGERLASGTVYFPPDDSHLLIDHSGYCTTTILGLAAPPSRPSITFTFNSIAKYYGSSAVGILLTGMGSDGADGLLTMRNSGGMTIAQDKASSTIFGMPKVAAEIGAAQHVLPLTQIAKVLADGV